MPSFVRHLFVALGLAALFAGLGLGGVALFGLERHLIYFPERELAATPAAFGLAYEDAHFTAADGTRLHGWYVPAPGAKVTLLWTHGNAGNISGRLENIRLLHDRLGVNVFIFDYRGYGRSEGQPTEKGLYQDAEAARQWFLSRPDAAASRLVYFGRSLGAAIAVELATRHTPAALILESPFTSVADMAGVLLPKLRGLGRLVPTKFASIDKIGAVRAPLLLVHGDMDEVVPYSLGKRLFEKANEPKTFYTIPGAHHNDTYGVGGREYWQVWQRFLEGV